MTKILWMASMVNDVPQGQTMAPNAAMQSQFFEKYWFGKESLL